MKPCSDTITALIKEQGFDIFGFAKAEPLSDEITNLNTWLDNKYNAGMAYMENNLEKRSDVRNILASARSVISVGLNYYRDEVFGELKDGKISRYAWGRDYHNIMWEKLEQLLNNIKSEYSDFEGVYYVDTGPVMDKVWAQKSGLGWIGKHTNVINREIGSWFFIGNLICNYELAYNEAHADFCGSCTACIDACPTGAIVDEYVVDGNSCISYLTIENKGEISEEFKGKFENWAFGCDLCQDVCPWNNKYQTNTEEQDFYKYSNKTFDADEISEMSNRVFNKRYFESPINRARAKGIRRNLNFLKD